MSNSHSEIVAVVTGAGRGLGSAMTAGLLRAGARVVGVDIDAEVLAAPVLDAKKESAEDRFLAIPADVTSTADLDAVVSRTLKQFGQIDVLINNAGINTETVEPGRPKAKNFRELKAAHYRRIMEVNAVAPFLAVQAVIEPMVQRGWGRIIGVTTSLDTMFRKGLIPYGSSKAAHEALLAAIAEELEGTGVTANVLVPGGPVGTRMTASYGVAVQAKFIPSGCMVKPLLWLCSRAADHVNGQRFVAAAWDASLPDAEAAKKCGAPAAWPQLGRQAIRPDAVG